MGRTARIYIFSVIAAGGCVLTAALANWSPPNPMSWAIYILLSVAAAVVKLRLPGMDGTYSLGFLPLLYGVAHFSLPETLIAVCAGAVAGSLLNTKKRSSLVQVLFNTANLMISVTACFLLARVWLAGELAQHRPAVIALVACIHFLINTAVVSGVLSLLQGKLLAEVYSQWYVWSFPYYLIGVALVGLIPSPGQPVSGEGWLVLLPLIYLVHFFVALLNWHASSPVVADQPSGSMPKAARFFILVVVAAGAILLVGAGLDWQSRSPIRFFSYLALAITAATLKIRLPRVGVTLTPTFVLVLAAIADMSWAEAVVISLTIGVVQCSWRPARRPMVSQMLFNPACVTLSTGFAYGVSRVALAPWLGQSVVGLLVVSTIALYSSNTVMMAAVLALVNRRPLSGVWQSCYFWSLPYYLVGAGAAGIITATGQNSQWAPALLVLPLMGLVFVTYRLHVRESGDRNVPVAA